MSRRSVANYAASVDRWRLAEQETAERHARAEAEQIELLRVAFEAGYRAGREDAAVDMSEARDVMLMAMRSGAVT